MRVVALSLVAMSLAIAVAHAAGLTPEQAASHVGNVETVCGVVASARYAARSRVIAKNSERSRMKGWRATPDDDEHYVYAIAL